MTATDEGKAAFATGKTHRDNPHAGERREDWSEGWYQARDAHDIANPRRSSAAEIAAAAKLDISQFGKRRARNWRSK